MVLATELYATLEAELCWSRTAALLRSWWFDSREEFASRRWYEDYGVRVSGIGGDPLGIIQVAIAAEQTLECLRRLNKQAYLLACHQVEHPQDRWFNERGTGVAELMGLERKQAERLFNAAKQFVWCLLEDDGAVPITVQEALK